MQSPKYLTTASVIKPSYFDNWGDMAYTKLANKLLGTASKFRFITPNMVSALSLVLYALGAGLIVRGGIDAYILAAIMLPSSYILDCLDGQLARYTGRSSVAGAYLDKTLDIIKLGIINWAMALAAYNLTGKTYYFLLGFLSCFGFLFRFYIKLETMFDAVLKDKEYFEKSRLRRVELTAYYDAKRLEPRTQRQQLNWLWFRHHSIFALDEAEHVTFAAIAILLASPMWWCWLFGVGQISIALVRLLQRGNQLVKSPSSLINPLRK